MTDNLSITFGLDFHSLNQLHVDFLEIQTLKEGVDQNIQLGNFILAYPLINFDQPIFNHISFQHDNHQQLIIFHSGQLDEFQFIPFILRSWDHRRIICIRRQKLCHMLQQMIQLICLFNKNIFHLIDFSNLFLHQIIHIKAVTFIWRDTPRWCMRLNDISQIFQIRHLISNRRRTQVQIRIFWNGPWAYRFTSNQICLNNTV